MDRWGECIARRAGRVLAAGVALVAFAAAYGLGVFGSLADGGFEDPGSESHRAAELMAEHFADREVDVVVVYSHDALRADDPAFRQRVEGTLAGLPDGPVSRATTWYDTGSPGLIGEDGRATRVLVRLAGPDEDAKLDAFDAIRDELAAPGLQTEVGGPIAVFADVNEQVSADIARAESVALPIVFVLSLLIFGSLAAALMPTLVGAIAVLGAFAVVRGLTGVTEISVFSINVITLLGMGLAIDYALFVVSRFREELAAQPDASRASVQRAVRRTMATAGRTVFFSGVIVAASLASLLIFPQSFLKSMGYGGIAAVLVAMVASLTVLPALLALLGRRIEFGRLPRPGTSGRHRRETASGQGFWARIARSVMRRPVAYLTSIGVALLLLGSPILGATWGSVDERVLPAGSPSRVAAEAQAAEFGGERASASVVLRGTDAAGVRAYVAQVEGLAAGVEAAPVAEASADGRRLTLVEVTWPGNGQTTHSQELLRDLRSVDVAGTAVVGGATAQTVDLVDSIFDRLPWMALLVAVVMFGLLFLAFGSLVLPVKAIVMNTVSIAASFGVVTWIFADGNLSGLLGFTSTGYLDATQPILMLAILFGLSMDYEVFLLSRIREEWDRTGDNVAAVAAGVQRTGRIITSAALLLAVVIGGFSTSGIVFLKMIGVGMLVAVLLDATVVRALLVPAAMRLLGPANWWAPAPLRRWWQRHGHREPTGPQPSPEPAVAPAARELAPTVSA